MIHDKVEARSRKQTLALLQLNEQNEAYPEEEEVELDLMASDPSFQCTPMVGRKGNVGTTTFKALFKNGQNPLVESPSFGYPVGQKRLQ